MKYMTQLRNISWIIISIDILVGGKNKYEHEH